MLILIACEYSGVVRDAFIDAGHDAVSCDLLPSESNKGEHIQGDCLQLLNMGWDMMIAHPPCTHLSNAGARFMYPKGVLNQDRLALAMKGKEFFMQLFNAPIPKIAIENPIPTRVCGLPAYQQVIQPYNFGDPYQKKTCLWLKGLPPLMHTCNMEKPESTKIAGNWFNKGGKDRQKNRAKFWPGIAKAMAQQWGRDGI